MHLNGVDAVLQRIILAQRPPWQLALLAYWNEARAELVRHRAAEDESTRLDAGDFGDSGAEIRRGELVDSISKRRRIAEQSGDVAEQYPRFGVVGNGAD